MIRFCFGIDVSKYLLVCEENNAFDQDELHSMRLSFSFTWRLQ